MYTDVLFKYEKLNIYIKTCDLYNIIIKDLTEASNELPNTIPTTSPFSAGGVGKTATAAVAKAYLAKVYLTRAYSEAKQAGDFQQAADLTH